MAERVVEPPKNVHDRNLRACLECKLIQSDDEFKEDGCPNCGRHSSTTPTFSGLVALMDPRQSWVAKWQGSADLAKGLYALTVVGEREEEEDDDELE